MKKKRVTDHLKIVGWTKLLRVMKLTAFLIFVLVVDVSASLYSQNSKVSVKVENGTLSEIFEKIEGQSEFRFFYQDEQIQNIQRKSIDVSNKKIEVILSELLNNTGLDFKIMDRHIILFNKTGVNTKTQDVNQQQQKSVSGIVTDSSGEGLPGVSVVVKGTTNGTITDTNGNYSLSNIPENAIVQFSFVGMKMKEIAVGTKTSVNVVLEEETIGIEEVVAIGYGVSRKSDLTGSVVRADLKSFESQPNINIMQSLQGSVPGLNVGAINTAGGTPNLTVRGQNSLSGSSAPLIVLDGIIYNGSMADLNPDDIESVDVLKDASSKAIYGSQAANGVLLITSKSGLKAKKPEFKYSTFYSVQTPSHILHPERRDEYIQKTKDAYYKDAYLAPDYITENPAFNLLSKWSDVGTTEGFNNGTDVDWLDLVTQTGVTNNHNISMAGSTETMSYYLSGGYTEQKGYVINDEYNRISIRANFDNKITNWLNVGFQSFITSADYSGVSPDTRIAYLLPSLNSPYDATGKLKEYPHASMRSPLYPSLIDDLDKRLNLFGNFYAKIDIPYVKGLSYKLNYSTNYRTTRQYRFDKYAQNNTGSAYKNNGLEQDNTIDNIVNYNRTFAEKHKLDFTGLYGYQKIWGDGTNASAGVFLNDALGYHSLESGDVTMRGVSSSAYDEYALYQMGRINYGYDSRYMVTATLRRDGFSGFGSNKKFGLFPSLAFAWVASNEKFVQEALPVLSNLKIRATYGKSGNRTIGRYGTLASIGAGYDYVFGSKSAYGQWINNLPNNNLGWESTTGLNLGLDFALLKGRVSGNIDYYNDKTEDILFNVNLPSITGFSSVLSNIGKIDNNGIELSINTINIKTNNFEWNTTFNFAKNKNKIVSILGMDKNADGKEDDLIGNSLFIGKARGAIYNYTIDGLFQIADTDIPVGYRPGNYKIKDISGIDGVPDGKIDPTYDRSIIGYAEPAYRFSIQNDLTYKNWSLMFFINSIQGGKNGYYGNITPSSDGAWEGGSLLGSNVVREWDYWTPGNPNAFFQGISNNGAINPAKYQQRSFIRLQDVTLTYKLDGALTKRIGLKGLDLNLSGKNLMTFTKWKGTDPELGLGMNAGHLPLQKSYSMGLNVTF